MTIQLQILVFCFATLGISGCIQPNSATKVDSSRPGYRLLPFMNVGVIFGPELSKIKTAEARVQQYLKQINVGLAKVHGFKLRAVQFSATQGNGLTIAVSARPEWLASSPQVLRDAIPVQITVEALTKGTNKQVLANLEIQIYE